MPHKYTVTNDSNLDRMFKDLERGDVVVRRKSEPEDIIVSGRYSETFVTKLGLDNVRLEHKGEVEHPRPRRAVPLVQRMAIEQNPPEPTVTNYGGSDKMATSVESLKPFGVKEGGEEEDLAPDFYRAAEGAGLVTGATTEPLGSRTDAETSSGVEPAGDQPVASADQEGDDAEEDGADADAEQAVDYQSMTKDQLKADLDRRSISYRADANKDELIKLAQKG